MPGPESSWFRRRLEQGAGFSTRLFSYPTVAEPLDRVVDRLRALATDVDAPVVHWVGHSLGGIVLLRLFAEANHAPTRPGRIVLLGTPACGSAAARQFGQLAVGRALIGRIVRDELLAESDRRAPQGRDLGIIAGTQSIGLGRLFARFNEPNDGTVAVRETLVRGAADAIQLPVSHLGMMLSARTVDETACFLRSGRFSLAPGVARPRDRAVF
jgi:pimeloyl-ACP methyl ester carboxylesterase